MQGHILADAVRIVVPRKDLALSELHCKIVAGSLQAGDLCSYSCSYSFNNNHAELNNPMQGCRVSAPNMGANREVY